MPTRTATPNRKSTTNAPSSTRKHKGVVDRTSGRSSPVVSMRSPNNKALTVTRRLLWINNGSPKNGTARYSGPPNVTELTQECSLWVVGSIGRCNTSIKTRSARVSKPKVSRHRSLSCRATRLSCECAPPAVPQLLLGHTALKPRTYLRPTAYPLHLLRLRKSVASTA